MVLMRFLIVILSLISSIAHAAVQCDDLLSFASSAVSEETKYLSPSARAYVNLIKFNIEKSNGVLDAAAANEILNASSFVNPFVDNTDSVSVQLTKAMKLIQSSIKSEDWVQVKEAVQDLIKAAVTENKDRRKKQSESAAVYAPRLIGVVDSPVHPERSSRQIINGRTFVAEGTIFTNDHHEGHLNIFEIVHDKYVPVTSLSFDRSVTVAPQWQVINGEVFLANLVDDQFLSVYKFNLQTLELKASTKVNGGARNSPQWQVVDGHIYLAIVAAFPDAIHLFELIDDKLVLQQSVADVGTGYRDTQWIVFNGRVYLAVDNDTEDRKLEETPLALFELVDGSFQRRIVDELGRYHESSASAQYIDGRMFVAVADMNHYLNLFELVDGNLVLRDEQKMPWFAREAPQWQVVQGRMLLAVKTQIQELLIYEFKDNKLEQVEAIKVAHDLDAKPQWRTLENGSIYIDLYNEKINKTHVFQILKVIEKKGEH